MNTMDRYLFKHFLQAYLIIFVSLIGLYITIDLFANADEFIEDHAGTLVFIRRVCKYYGVHTLEYFSRISPFITSLSAMTTLAILHRNNELVALLAAGIPTRRALAPILLGVLLVIGLGIVNREILLPRFSVILQRLHEDIEGNQKLIPTRVIDRDQILFRAENAFRQDLSVTNVCITLPEKIAGQTQEIKCARAFYQRDPATQRVGWLLKNPTPIQIVEKNDHLRELKDGTGDVYLFARVTFSDLIRQPNWKEFASLRELIDYIREEEVKSPQSLRISIHGRLMQPILDLLLVLLGVPFVLQWEHRTIFRGVAIALILSGLLMVFNYSTSYFANFGYLDPASASWLPIFVFGPIAFALMHRIGT